MGCDSSAKIVSRATRIRRCTGSGLIYQSVGILDMWTRASNACSERIVYRSAELQR
jgi:hypothetical protein